MGLHTAIRVAVTALALSACLAGGAQAAEPEKSGKADQCRGVDMLAETKARDPELFSKIMAQADTVRNGDALPWKVERDGAPASYLFGTVHLTDERVTRVSPAVHQALKDSKTVALEVADLSEAATTKVIAKSAPLVTTRTAAASTACSPTASTRRSRRSSPGQACPSIWPPATSRGSSP